MEIYISSHQFNEGKPVVVHSSAEGKEVIMSLHTLMRLSPDKPITCGLLTVNFLSTFEGVNFQYSFTVNLENSLDFILKIYYSLLFTFNNYEN